MSHPPRAWTRCVSAERAPVARVVALRRRFGAPASPARLPRPPVPVTSCEGREHGEFSGCEPFDAVERPPGSLRRRSSRLRVTPGGRRATILELPEPEESHAQPPIARHPTTRSRGARPRDRSFRALGGGRRGHAPTPADENPGWSSSTSSKRASCRPSFRSRAALRDRVRPTARVGDPWTSWIAVSVRARNAHDARGARARTHAPTLLGAPQRVPSPSPFTRSAVRNAGRARTPDHEAKGIGAVDRSTQVRKRHAGER